LDDLEIEYLEEFNGAEFQREMAEFQRDMAELQREMESVHRDQMDSIYDTNDIHDGYGLSPDDREDLEDDLRDLASEMAEFGQEMAALQAEIAAEMVERMAGYSQYPNRGQARVHMSDSIRFDTSTQIIRSEIDGEDTMTMIEGIEEEDGRFTIVIRTTHADLIQVIEMDEDEIEEYAN